MADIGDHRRDDAANNNLNLLQSLSQAKQIDVSSSKKSKLNEDDGDENDDNNRNNRLKSSINQSTQEDEDDDDGAIIRKKIKQLKLHADPNAPLHLDYKSGAVYDGQLRDNVKFGQGTFVWPNGDKYVGEFRSNSRYGYGMQYWNDGSRYEGSFNDDKRAGRGVHIWKNGELYEGDWYQDYRHGFGKYKWFDANVYEGMFFLNNREGYGTLRYSTGELFKGLYKNDNRFGPGILIYPNNNANDVGYWHGDKLIRLIVSFGVQFNFAELDPVDKRVELASWFDREFLIYDTLNPPNLFLNRVHNLRFNKFLKTDPHIEKALEEKFKFTEEYLKALERTIKTTSASPTSKSSSLASASSSLSLSSSFNKDQYDKTSMVLVDNLTPTLLKIFKHMCRFGIFQRTISRMLHMNIRDIIESARDSFSSPGILELASLEFMSACNEKNLEKARSLKSLVNIDVCDNHGYSSLILAVLKCDARMINYLLDNGANVNHLIDNGLSALMICVVRYYSSDKFLPNCALDHKDLPITRKIRPESIIYQPRQTSTPKLEMQGELETAIINTNQTVPDSSNKGSEFESDRSFFKYNIPVNERLAEQYVNLVSKLESIEENESDRGALYKKAAHLHFLNEVSSIIELLLRRGADPSLSCLPYPALCFAVAAGDVKIVRLLLEKGADSNCRMPSKYSSLTPLCLACGVLGETSLELVKLLLDSLADPNAAAQINNEYLSMNEDGWQNEPIADELFDFIGGRTPLHIACSRNDPYAPQIVALLLEHHANPNAICNGHSPLSLAIASGNREAIDLLLKTDSCDSNLPLTHGVGSALCAICSTLYEHRWPPAERIKLVDKLLIYGADILQPIAFGPKRLLGSVVDYAYYMFNSDTRIAHTPYHSLSHDERNTHNARKELLQHLSNRFREKALERARGGGGSSIDATGHSSHYFMKKKSWGPAIRRSRMNIDETISDSESTTVKSEMRRTGATGTSKWCYYCGRSVGIKLMLCSRCKKVSYCSNTCKNKAWTEFHRSECQLAESQNTYGYEFNEKHGPPLLSKSLNELKLKETRVKSILLKIKNEDDYLSSELLPYLQRPPRRHTHLRISYFDHHFIDAAADAGSGINKQPPTELQQQQQQQQQNHEDDDNGDKDEDDQNQQQHLDHHLDENLTNRRNRSAQRARQNKELLKIKQSNERLLNRAQFNKNSSLSINKIYNEVENYSFN